VGAEIRQTAGLRRDHPAHGFTSRSLKWASRFGTSLLSQAERNWVDSLDNLPPVSAAVEGAWGPGEPRGKGVQTGHVLAGQQIGNGGELGTGME